MSLPPDFWSHLNNFVSDFRLHAGESHGWLFAMVLTAFTTMNSIRLLAYIPQILAAARCSNGAAGVSHLTWSLFFLSHLTTVAYAVVCLGDLVMALVFAGNAMACLVILAVIRIKRRRYATSQMRPRAS